jgi:hypothetical protein
VLKQQTLMVHELLLRSLSEPELSMGSLVLYSRFVIALQQDIDKRYYYQKSTDFFPAWNQTGKSITCACYLCLYRSSTVMELAFLGDALHKQHTRIRTHYSSSVNVSIYNSNLDIRAASDEMIISYNMSIL